MEKTNRVSRILVAGTNLLFRRGLCTLLSGERPFELVGEAGNSYSLLSLASELRPDVLVLDLDVLAGSAGMTFAASLRQAAPQLRILVLAQEDTAENLALAAALGATGFLLKNSSPARLLEAIGNIALGRAGMNSSGLLPGLQALATQTAVAPAASAAPVLTAREQEVARLLAEGRTVRMVANELDLSMKTVEAHKLNLMRKLDIHDRASLIAYASKTGMIAPAYSAS